MAVRRLKGFVNYTKAIKTAHRKAHALTLIKVGQEAELQVKANIRQTFPAPGRVKGRKMSGRLLNSVNAVFETRKGALPRGFIEVSGIPYGAIHEFGGTIKPKKAKHLWLKMYDGVPKNLHKLTPTQFIDRLRNQKKTDNPQVEIFATDDRKMLIAGMVRNFKTRDDKVTVLFVLRKRVKIPKRPYVKPGVDAALKKYRPSLLTQFKKAFAEMRGK